MDLEGQRLAPDLDPSALRAMKRTQIPVITDPNTVATADLGLADDDWVVGVETDAGQRAYPVSTLQKHHIVNDRLGYPILVTFCAMCRSAACFDPVLEDRRLIFEVSGDYRRNMTMRDHHTGTVWSQFTGEALVGPLVGRTLEMLPSQLGTASQWLTMHPLSTSPESMRPSPGQEDRLNLGSLPRRSASMDNPLVLGLDVGSHHVAFRIDTPVEEPQCIQASVAGIDLVFLASAGSFPTPFDRRIDGTVVDFALHSSDIKGGESTWTAAGRAVDGPLAGASLTYIPARTTSWEKWREFHRESPLFSPFDGGRPDDARGA